MAWLSLFVAGIFEVIWAICLKYSNGFTNIKYSLFTVVGMIISFYFLSQATKVLPIGTAYTIWTGIGALGAMIFGVIFFKEAFTLWRVIFLIFILVGILGLKFTAEQ